MNALSSRIARSRYFSRISSSVAGIAPSGFDVAPRFSLPVHQALRAPCARDAARAARRAAGGVAFVCRNFSAWT